MFFIFGFVSFCFQLNEIRTSGDKVRERTAEIKRYDNFFLLRATQPLVAP